MTRLAGRLLLATAALHAALGAWLGRGALLPIARDGFFNALWRHSNRQLWFWFVALSVPLALLGAALAHGELRPRSGWLGWSLAALAVAGAALAPLSLFWLLFLPAGLLIAGARKPRAAPTEWKRGEFSISTDPDRVDAAAAHEFLAGSYWAGGVPREFVDRSIGGSIAFGMFHAGRQIGFARVITDRSTYAYLSDVYVLEAWRGRGLALWLMEIIRAHPDLQNLRRWMLSTRDAHALYSKAGFQPLAHPERFMEITDPDVYARLSSEPPG
ncbi:MAG: GNAT family N-acetyltransferase [Acidobacteriota bacterium]